MQGFNGTKTIVAVPGSGVPPVALLATGPVRYVKIVESQLTPAGAANAAQGFEYALPNDGFVANFGVVPYDVAEIGDPMALRGSHGTMLGNGPNVNIGIGATPAATLANLRSLTATPTYVVVDQYY